MNRRILSRMTLVLLQVCMVTACVTTAVHGKELRIGYPVDIVTLDPGAHRSRSTEVVLNNLYDTLLVRDSAMQLVPNLAADWQLVSPTVYEFRLREDVILQDGTFLGAADVAYTFDRLMGKGEFGRVSPRASLLGPLEEVEVVDDRTIRFILSEPWPVFPAMLPFQQIIGRLQGADGAGTDGVPYVGSGPFTLADRSAGKFILFDRSETYFGGPDQVPPTGKACVEQLELNVVPNNESRVAGLLAGDFDLVLDILPHSIPVIREHPGVDIVSVTGTRSFYLAVDNMAKPFDDPRMREAIALALDRHALIAEHLYDQAAPIDGILSPSAFGKNADLKKRGHDPARARALLEEMGHSEGLSLELDVSPQYFQLAEAISLQLAEVGIAVKTNIDSPRETAARWRNAGAGSHGRLWLRSWGNASLDPVGIFDPTHRTGGRGNVANYSNPALDALLDEASLEQDPTSRAALYRRAEAIANADLPYIYLWVPKDVYGISNRVSGFVAAPDGRLNLQDVCVE